MKHLEWYESLSPGVQDSLWLWKTAAGPKSQNQDHYLVKDAAKALRLDPITIRGYIREGKIFARKLGKKWLIPADAIARYIYNNDPANQERADDDIPMGVVIASVDSEDGNIEDQIVDYRIVSDKELQLFETEADLANFMGNEYGMPPGHEVEAIVGHTNILARLGIIPPTLDDLTKDQLGKTLLDSTFDFPPRVAKDLRELSKKEWSRMPLIMIREEFRRIFTRNPDIDDLRFFRVVLSDFQNTY